MYRSWFIVGWFSSFLIGCGALDYKVVAHDAGADLNEVVLDARVGSLNGIDDGIHMWGGGDAIDRYEMMFLVDRVVKGRHDYPALNLTVRAPEREEEQLIDPAGRGFSYGLPLRVGFDRGPFGRIRNLHLMQMPGPLPTSR